MNRERDNTSANVGIGNWPEINKITTDTGGDETDYFDAASGDFRLIDGSPGRNVGGFGINLGGLAVVPIVAGGGGSVAMAGMFG